MKRFFKDYSLSIVLALLFLVSWLLQAIFMIPTEGWTAFASATFENWQSEFLQLFAFVTLTSVFIHKNSPESRDSDDRMEEKIDKILERLDGEASER
jgi:uncharacterized membrane protein YhdT